MPANSVCSWSCMNHRRSGGTMDSHQLSPDPLLSMTGNLGGGGQGQTTARDKSNGRCSPNNSSANIYHEKQMKELCALHALNNLFQDRRAFSKKDLDDICVSLSPDHFINPHRSVLGLGNYDVNVIMAALQKKDFGTVWFDKRKKISCLVFENIEGYILNIPTDYKWGLFRLPFKRKHWIAIKKIDDLYYNLDSKLEAPELIGREGELLSYLGEQLENREKELLLVVTSDVEQTVAWRKEDPSEALLLQQQLQQQQQQHGKQTSHARIAATTTTNTTTTTQKATVANSTHENGTRGELSQDTYWSGPYPSDTQYG